MQNKKLHGIVPPAVTPLLDDIEFDSDSAAKLYDYFLEAGVHGLFLFGSSGEGPWLTSDIRTAGLKVAREKLVGKIPLLVGVLAPGTAQVIEQGLQAKEYGANYLVVAAPYYFSVSQAEIKEHFRIIHQAVGVPILAYDIPVTTHVKIQLETMLEMAAEGIIVGVKDSSGDVGNYRRLSVKRPKDFCMFTGSELLVDESVITGSEGAVPGLANVDAALFVKVYNLVREGRYSDAVELQNRLNKLFDVFASPDGSICAAYAIGAMKIGVYLKGIISSMKTVAPFTAVTPEQIERTKALMIEADVLKS